jgi:hypothetical protein
MCLKCSIATAFRWFLGGRWGMGGGSEFLGSLATIKESVFLVTLCLGVHFG